MGDVFKGASSNSKGGTNAQHNEALVKMGFIQPRELVEMPKGLQYLFDIFLEVRFSRNNENKLVPRERLTFLDVNQYKEAYQISLSAIEVDATLRADAIYETASS